MSDHRNPLSINIPYEFKSPQDYPSEAVASRFQAYRDILKSLIAYLEQYASVQEEIVRQQVRLQQAVGASDLVPDEKYSGPTHRTRGERTLDEEALSALNQFFLPIGNGSIQDIPTVLTKFHQQNVQNGKRTLREIRQVIIPKFEDLRRELVSKIKEIKTLHNDFDSKLAKQVSATGQLLAVYSHSIDLANRLDMASTVASKTHHEPGNVVESLKKDPYLAKIKLQSQLKHQLHEESYLYHAYKNLQTAGEQLESIVVKDIQNYMAHFLSLVETEKSSVSNFLVPTLSEGFLAKEPNFEWQSYVERNFPKSSALSGKKISGQFIDLSFPPRQISDLYIPLYSSLLSVPVRQGYLERKSKFLKSNTRSYYVLTCSYLHEFKTHDLKKDPTNSISLDYCLVSEHSKDPAGTKFDLYSKAPNSLMHRSHTSVFKCETPQAMRDWLNDIKALTLIIGPAERAKSMSKLLTTNAALEKKDSRISRVSSILSAQTNAISLKSGTSGARAAANLSPKKRLSVISKNESIPSSSQNRRVSSTFSNRNQPSQLMSNYNDNYNDRDDTLLTSAGDKALRVDSTVDEHGDLVLKSPRAPANSGFTNNTSNVPQFNLPGIALNAAPQSNGGYTVSTNQPSNSQVPPQNYQYYMNQMALQPQQFYDPVLQQFFTINAIPALQVGSLQQQNGDLTPNGTNPMPQYFPSSPQPTQNGAFPQNMATAPTLGFSVPQQAQYQHQEEQKGQINTPYPVQFGESLPSGSELKNQHNAHGDKDVSELADSVAKATVDEN